MQAWFQFISLCSDGAMRSSVPSLNFLIHTSTLTINAMLHLISCVVIIFRPNKYRKRLQLTWSMTNAHSMYSPREIIKYPT